MNNYKKALTVGDVKKILEDFPDDMLICKFSGYDHYGNYSMNFWNCDIELSYLKKEKSYIPHKGEIIYNDDIVDPKNDAECKDLIESLPDSHELIKVVIIQ